MDWIDEADGVFRGGGVKGLALAGALQGMSQHPTKPVTKWVSVAGASAGFSLPAVSYSPSYLKMVMKSVMSNDASMSRRKK